MIGAQRATTVPDLATLFPSTLDWAAQYVTALADNIQVSSLMVAPSLLAVASVAATGACRFEGRPGHREVPVLWCFTLALPGERKSAALNAVKAPLLSATADSGETESESSAPASTAPGYSTSAVLAMDASRAAIYEQVALHDGRMAILSDEDHIVSKLARSPGDGLELYLKGYFGDHFSKHIHDTTIDIADPNIVLSLLVQPAVAATAITTPTLRERGFPQRFLYFSVPQQKLRSYLDINEVPAALTDTWDRCVRAIAALPRLHGDRSIPLDRTALKVFGRIADRLDAERLNEDRDPFEKEWLAKAAGQVLRIAGLFALMRSADAKSITQAEVIAAEAWVDLSLDHLHGLLRNLGGSNKAVAQAQRVLRWLVEHQLDHASANQITQGLRGPGYDRVSEWAPVFDLLVTHHWLRPSRREASGMAGGRPSMGYDVNPALLQIGLP
jgi:hypothetical protein